MYCKVSCKKFLNKPSSPDNYDSDEIAAVTDDFRPITPPPTDLNPDLDPSADILNTPPPPRYSDTPTDNLRQVESQETVLSDNEIKIDQSVKRRGSDKIGQPRRGKKRKIPESDSESDNEITPVVTERSLTRIEQETLRKGKKKQSTRTYTCRDCWFEIGGKKVPSEFHSYKTYQAHLAGKSHKKRIAKVSELTKYCNFCKKKFTKHDFQRHLSGHKHQVAVEKAKKNLKF